MLKSKYLFIYIFLFFLFIFIKYLFLFENIIYLFIYIIYLFFILVLLEFNLFFILEIHLKNKIFQLEQLLNIIFLDYLHKEFQDIQ